MPKRKIVKKNVSMKGILTYLENSRHKKASGVKFTFPDIQGYIRRGRLPKYMGDIVIEKVDNLYAKLYNIVENEV